MLTTLNVIKEAEKDKSAIAQSNKSKPNTDKSIGAKATRNVVDSPMSCNFKHSVSAKNSWCHTVKSILSVRSKNRNRVFAQLGDGLPKIALSNLFAVDTQQIVATPPTLDMKVSCGTATHSGLSHEADFEVWAIVSVLSRI
eukprot:5773592-Amphidinium_carterae.1